MSLLCVGDARPLNCTRNVFTARSAGKMRSIYLLCVPCEPLLPVVMPCHDDADVDDVDDRHAAAAAGAGAGWCDTSVYHFISH